MTPLRRASILLVSLFAVALGLGWDFIHPGGDPGIGPLQEGLCLLGLAGVLLGVLPDAARLYYARCMLAAAAMYVSALAFELIALPPVAHWGLVNASLQGMVQPSGWGGYELTPGWHGRYEDGIRSADVAINTLGDRDDAPSPLDAAASERVLLLGDSFAFGWGLEKQDTIEGQIERESHGRVVAYNLGVGGYGPGDVLAHYRERTAFAATRTFFLLYGNDLRKDNCTPAFHTAVDGMIVPRTHEDGSRYTREEVERRLADQLDEDDHLWLSRLKDALTLNQLRSRLLLLVRRDYPLASGAADQYTRECALSAAERADEMGEIARARGGQFAVVILPTPGETLRHTYYERMQECMGELRRRSIPVLEVRDQLAISDYFKHHEHLNPSGARKVAEAILATLELTALAQGE